MGSPGLPFEVGILRRFLRRVTTFRTVTILIHRFADRAIARVPLDLRRVTPDNVGDASSMEDAARIEEFRRFLAHGDEGYYVYADGVVVHRTWCVRGPGTARLWHSYGRIELLPDDAYIHYCATAPAARGRGIYPQVIAHVAEQARARGARRVLIWAERDNVASQRGIARAGFVPEKTVTLSIRFGRGSQAERSQATGAPASENDRLG
jgi:GNAT superfamily N-acetyltransferase